MMQSKEIKEISSKTRVVYNKDIIKSIISLATKEINGVSSMSSSTRCKVAKWINGKKDNGVKVSNGKNGAVIDVFINIFSDSNVADIAWRIQENIKASVRAMMDVKVLAVNVNIVGVDFTKLEAN